MPTRDITDFAEIAHERELLELETSTERFDRMAFAERALALVRPPTMRVALCEGIARVRVEAGRAWGEGEGARWAILSVPPRASRRAIAVAITELVGARREPYALDVLMSELCEARVA